MYYKSIYIGFVLNHIQKVITQIDRDPYSPTYGSCDRNYWHLKIRDFSSAILQQTGLTLALLFKIQFSNNIYYQNKNIYEWARGTLDFLKKIQLSDGSFNEYYPNEHGFPPTAFALFGAAETYKILKLEDSEILRTLKKAGRFLARNSEIMASNQEIASIAALYSLYTITKDSWLINVINVKLENILDKQSKEGWFPEYGGADLGYLSVSLDMLAEYYWQSRDERVVEPLNRIIDFIKYFCHPDGSIGGEYGSRNTIYFLPNGIEVMVNLGNKTAKSIKSHIFNNCGEKGYFQNSIDDRYMSHYVLHSFIRAIQKEKEICVDSDFDLPCYYENQKYFPEAGLLVTKNKNYYCIISAKKGGIIKVFNESSECAADCGYRIPYSENICSATNWLDNNYKISFSENQIVIEGFFNVIKIQVPSPIKHFLLRILSFLFGSSLIYFLKKKLIFVNNHDKVAFNRVINLYESKIVIKDHINSSYLIKKLESANGQSLRHVASGKFYSNTDLLFRERIILDNFKKAEITQTICIKTNEIVYENVIQK